jgi:hypothetical protein
MPYALDDFSNIPDKPAALNNVGVAEVLLEAFGAVGDGTTNDAPAIVSAITSGRKIGGRANKTYRITANMNGGFGAGATRLDLAGSKVLIDYTQTSAEQAVDVGPLENATFEIASGQTLRRLHYAMGDVRNVTYTSVDQQPSGSSLQDAMLKPGAANLLFENVRLTNFDRPILIDQDGVRVRDLWVESYSAGLRCSARLDVDGFYFGSKALGTTGAPGENAFGSGPNGAGPIGGTVRNGVIADAGEHAVYNSRDIGQEVDGVHYSNILILRSGRSGVKLRNYKNGSVSDIYSYNAATVTAPGENEDNFHFERLQDYTLRNLVGDHDETQNHCGFNGLYIFGSKRIDGENLYFNGPVHAGVHIEDMLAGGDEQEPTPGIFAPCADIYLRRVFVRGRIGLKIEHLGRGATTDDVKCGQIEVLDLTVRDAPAEPLYINVPTGILAGKKIIVTGTYTAAAAPVVDYTNTQIDTSGFVPANREASVAATATLNLSHLAAERILITSGGTQCTSFGSGPRGAERTVIASGIGWSCSAAAAGHIVQLAVGEEARFRCNGGTSWSLVGMFGANRVVAAGPVLLAGQAMQGPLYVDATGHDTSNGMYGPAMVLRENGRARAAIAVKHTSADPDQTGLAFLVHLATATANEAPFEAGFLNHAGDLSVTRGLTMRPLASVTPVNNGDLTFEATSDTTITVKLKGSDGTVRSGTITLA